MQIIRVISVFICFFFHQLQLSHSIVGNKRAPLTSHHAHLLVRPGIGSPVHHTFIGSGSLITKLHVLTCAQNVFGFNYIRVGVGSDWRHNLTFYRSRRSVWHPEFNRENLWNNIAIIALEVRVEFDEHVQPIALPSSGVAMPFPFEEGTTTGFGMVDGENPIYSPHLLRSFHRVLTNSECTSRWPHMNLQMAQNFCALDHRKITNICGGDQGSAFTVMERGILTVFGIASFTNETCDPENGAVLVRVSSYLKWIQTVIGEERND